MSKSRGRQWSILLTGLIVLFLELLAPSATVRAHPADVYLQATYITLAPEQIVVELDLSPGVLVAPQILPQPDTDGDQQISSAETQAYVNVILQNVELQTASCSAWARSSRFLSAWQQC